MRSYRSCCSPTRPAHWPIVTANEFQIGGLTSQGGYSHLLSNSIAGTTSSASSGPNKLCNVCLFVHFLMQNSSLFFPVLQFSDTGGNRGECWLLVGWFSTVRSTLVDRHVSRHHTVMLPYGLVTMHPPSSHHATMPDTLPHCYRVPCHQP